MDMTIRVATQAEALIPEIRRELRALDSALPVPSIITAEARLSQQLGTRRFQAQALGAFAVVALAFAGAGLYAALMYQVALRRREIGIRTALGAPPRRHRPPLRPRWRRTHHRRRGHRSRRGRAARARAAKSVVPNCSDRRSELSPRGVHGRQRRDSGGVVACAIGVAHQSLEGAPGRLVTGNQGLWESCSRKYTLVPSYLLRTEHSSSGRFQCRSPISLANGLCALERPALSQLSRLLLKAGLCVSSIASPRLRCTSASPWMARRLTCDSSVVQLGWRGLVFADKSDTAGRRARRFAFRYQFEDSGHRLRATERLRGAGREQDNVWVFDRAMSR